MPAVLECVSNPPKYTLLSGLVFYFHVADHWQSHIAAQTDAADKENTISV